MYKSENLLLLLPTDLEKMSKILPLLPSTDSFVPPSLTHTHTHTHTTHTHTHPLKPPPPPTPTTPIGTVRKTIYQTGGCIRQVRLRIAFV